MCHRREFKIIYDKEKGATTTEIEEKKEYLKKYLSAVHAVKRIEDQIEELRSGRMNPSMVLDGTPKSKKRSDLSDYMVLLEELENRMIRERYRAIKSYTDIFKKVEQLKEETEKNILTLRYIKGYTFERIADEMQYSFRQITRLHTIALQNFKMS